MLTKLYTNPSRHVMFNTGSIWKKVWQFNACNNLQNFYAVGISFYITIPNLYQPSFPFPKNKWTSVVGIEGLAEKSPKHMKPFAVPHPNPHTWLRVITPSIWWIIPFSCYLHFWIIFSHNFFVGKQIVEMKINLFKGIHVENLYLYWNLFK